MPSGARSLEIIITGVKMCVNAKAAQYRFQSKGRLPMGFVVGAGSIRG